MLAIAMALSAVAQPTTDNESTPMSRPELCWSIDFNAVLNNREGGTEETPDQTFFFTHITPQIGLCLDSARHTVMGGVTWYQPMSNELHGYKVVPNLYYSYHNKGLTLSLGVIPTGHDYPLLWRSDKLMLRSDSIDYVQPVIRGAVVNYCHASNMLDAWIDWRQIQTAHRREAFAAGFHERLRLTRRDTNSGNLWLSGIVQYSHLAKSKENNEEQGVVDHLLLNPALKWANAHCDSQRRLRGAVSLGLLASLDRDRHDTNRWLSQMGFYGSAGLGWRWLQVEETVYAGKRQMPLYAKYGSLLYWGDQWLHNKFYSRTDVTATIYSRPFVNLEARLVFHASDKATGFWQQVTARFFFDSKMAHGRSRAAARLKPRF